MEISRKTRRIPEMVVAAWLASNGPMPEGIGTVKGLDENLRLQDRVARKLKSLRRLHG